MYLLLFIILLTTQRTLQRPWNATESFSNFHEDSRHLKSSNFFHLLKHKLKIQIFKVSTTAAPSDCICVPYYQCDSNSTIITNGAGIINVRITQTCIDPIQICCKRPLNTPSMAPIITQTTPPLIFSTSSAPLMTAPPTTQPPVTQPPTTQPPPTQPPTTQPPTTQPPTTQPPTTQPPTTQPPTTQPPTTQPPTTQPPTTQPPTTQPPTTKPPTTQPPTTQPITLPPPPPPTFPPLNCVCVPRNLCDANGYIIVAGEGILNPRQTQFPCPADQICCTPRVTTINFPTNPIPTILPASTTTQQIIIITVQPQGPPATIGPSQNCVCVSVFQCDNNGFIIVSGAGYINPRFPIYRRSSIVASCDVDKVCCKLPSPGQDSSVGFPGSTRPVGINPRFNDTSLEIVGVIKNPGTINACVCTKSWTCSQGNIVALDPVGILDPRFSYCPVPNEVCCRLQGITMNSVVLPGSSVVVNQDGITSGGNSMICGVRGPPCNGVQCPTASGETYFAEFPWMVALINRPYRGAPGEFICGASMINQKAVLTAAHCIYNRQPGILFARFGEWNTANESEPLPFQELEVQAIIQHPQYYNGGLYHDVAVLILTAPVTFAANIMPVCLPYQGTIFPPGTRCLATGWGRENFGGSYATVLRKIDLPLVERSECQQRLRSTELGNYFELHGSFLCAGGELKKDTCTGDGGGPLVCPNSSGQFFQVGIISWGMKCGTTNPAVYADVGQHRQWIDQQLANYGIL